MRFRLGLLSNQPSVAHRPLVSPAEAPAALLVAYSAAASNLIWNLGREHTECQGKGTKCETRKKVMTILPGKARTWLNRSFAAGCAVATVLWVLIAVGSYAFANHLGYSFVKDPSTKVSERLVEDFKNVGGAVRDGFIQTRDEVAEKLSTNGTMQKVTEKLTIETK